MAAVLMLLRRFRADHRGNFAIMSAGLMTLVVGCAGLAVDLGTIFADRRKTQSTADLAAITAASNLNSAVNAATATVTQNNFPASALVSVQLGTYTANSAIAPQSRFATRAVGTTNAARVTLNTQTPLYFARYLTGARSYTIQTSATATSTAMASFAIGSRLLALNGGVINAMLGSTLSLSVIDYQALLGAQIDALDFLSALATRVNMTGVSYNTLLTSNIKVPDIIAAALAAQQTTNGANPATTALSTISQAVSSLTTKITPGSLIDVGPFANLTVGQMPKLSATVSLFDLLSTTAQIANGMNQIATSVDLGLPGIAKVTVLATVGERPVGSGWVALGSQSASVHTAQTRLLATIQVPGSGSVSTINLPVYVEVASGTATLDAVSCGRPNINTSQVTLGATPGIVNAWIGGVTAADMTNFTIAPNPPPATLVNLSGITVTGRANAYMGNTTPTNVNFSYSDIQSLNMKTVTTTNFTSSLTSSLLGNLALNVNVGPLALPIPGLGATVAGILNGATSPVDQVLASALATLGVSIGQTNLWVMGIRCDGAVLVN
ncbi:pilus assembly protein TadG-related protein [Bradyrhizobium sp. ISRA443]|uniref:pilus assembly protein TadG-related protein n=1 Tax=unclassified Bradyrhizobium TaxID=2631580 RepID=UPI00247AA4F0|nr:MULTISPECIES: pilus assembly protein TadG-related protein [unclassified Bradyrhizobium]WGR93793.1 pilus assembly protein TadG-related protein [Bradyrhizobium sp. ISRA435]WGR98398.1 pilus assembly protein TadG-related protein [Bradyrhizobium sp. ISRA436]WGS05287.1 pilus assembly protein TadG-related protein [Bradyrhizobium sp. ISRA437]WGS12173.1 pilus assembly protein TadG-related protein [Bradyrhizobium sp. ISRA443]